MLRPDARSWRRRLALTSLATRPLGGRPSMSSDDYVRVLVRCKRAVAQTAAAGRARTLRFPAGLPLGATRCGLSWAFSWMRHRERAPASADSPIPQNRQKGAAWKTRKPTHGRSTLSRGSRHPAWSSGSAPIAGISSPPPPASPKRCCSARIALLRAPERCCTTMAEPPNPSGGPVSGTVQRRRVSVYRSNGRRHSSEAGFALDKHVSRSRGFDRIFDLIEGDAPLD